jgi:hypothetical protein
MSQHYALVSKNQSSVPLKLVGGSSEDDDAASSNTTSNIRQELIDIYQVYADLYPNPKLIEERRQKETLLKAAKAASAYQYQHDDHKNKKKKSNSGGFFSFLFGGGSNDNDDNDHGNNNNKSRPKEGSSSNDDDLLEYTQIPNEYDDGTLCGTRQSLDVTCIPPEVYSTTRFHLSSTRTRRDHPNALRHGPTKTSTKSQPSTFWVVVGLGEIAEFNDNSNAPPRIVTTSDRMELMGYAESSNEFHLHNVRGTVLSENSISISWGFLDGITIFYRRIQYNSQYLNGDGWEVIWMVGPSQPVLENMTGAGDLFHDDQDQPGSPLLRISDCIPLKVQIPSLSSSEPNFVQDDDQQQPSSSSTVITLAISRLGGYVELVPLPTQLWNGPILTSHNYRPPKRKQGLGGGISPAKRKRGGGGGGGSQQHSHYALGKNIACPPQTIALTTLDYHIDVQSLEAFRTPVNSETVWDNQAFPESPPAEFLLAASGLSKDGQYEMITFWTVSTLFPETPDPQDEIGFQLHSSLIEVISIDCGSPVSVFATPEIMSRWRTPREVELKDTATSAINKEMLLDNNVSDELQKTRATIPVTTLSTAAPIVSMRFSDSDGSTSAHSGPFLSILDWNGGVQIFDCSIMGRVAAQNMPLHEYEQYQNASQEDPSPLATNIVSRSHFATALQKETHPTVSNLHWLGSSGFGTGSTMPSLVLLVHGSKTLAVATFILPLENNFDGAGIREEGDLDASILSMTFPASGAAMKSADDSSLAFVSLQRGKLKSLQQPTRIFKYFVMEQLQPIAIVETLARDGKYEQAIESAKKLSNHEQESLTDVITQCHRRLWETERIVESLEATNDSPYIIREAISVCEDETCETNLSLEKLCSVLTLGLACSEKTREMSKLEVIRELIVRLGTYQLLCQHFGSVPSLKRFRCEARNASLHKLSLQFARSADIAALSVVIFRHRRIMGEKVLDIMSALPLSLDPTTYCHLLPVIRRGKFSDYFLASDDSEVPWSDMPRYISETLSCSVVLGLFDEKVVLDDNKGFSGEKSEVVGDLEAIVARWFLSRGANMQKFIGKVEDVIRLCAFGLECLSPHFEEKNVDHESSSIKQLYTTWCSASSLQSMLLDEIVPIDGSGISTDDLMDMKLVDLLDLVFDCQTDSSRILYRFKEYVQPIILEKSSANINDETSSIDKALEAYCVNEARKCHDSSPAAAKRALAACAAIADCSKSSIPKRDRLIKQKEVLIDMVLTVHKEMMQALSKVNLSVEDEQELVGYFWRLYESLPARLPTGDSSTEFQMETLFRHLICIDIVGRWPGCKPFASYLEIDGTNNDGKEESKIGESVVIKLCRSFNNAVQAISLNQDKVSLFRDLLSDVENLNALSFNKSLDVATIVCMHVVPELIETGLFGLVSIYLGHNGPVVDAAQVQCLVLDYVDNAVFSESGDGNSMAHAIRCQDILGPLLPEAQSAFQSIRRYLDAAHFVDTVIFEGKNALLLLPKDFKRMGALDSVECVLRTVPESVVCGSPEWIDEVFAQNANQALRDAKSSHNDPAKDLANVQLPVLPGGAIFHLATILGLEDSTSVLVVKCRVVHYALKCGFYGAAASISRTLIHETNFGSDSAEAQDLAKVKAVADTVSQEMYADLTTKKELCNRVLSRFRLALSVTNSDPFNTIIQTSAALNLSLSRFNQDFNEASPQRKESLLMRPLARLYKHIFYEYNTDVHRLFFDLVKQTEHSEVHDSLMNALSRFVVYWCIHDSKTLKRFISLMDKADAEDNLALGCSLILHIPSNLTATNCVHELEKISADQAANVASEERFGTSNSICVPNIELIRRLIDRGYSENAARRAVMMTRNSGYNDALGWAVMHTMDPDFNQPIAILKSDNKKYIDEEAIQLLQKSLVQISRVLEDSSTRANLIKYIESQHGDLATSSHENTQGKRVNTFGRTVGAKDYPRVKNVSQRIKQTPPPPPPQPKKKEQESQNSSSSNQAAPKVSHTTSNGFAAAGCPPAKQTSQQSPLTSVNPPSQVPTATTALNSQAVLSRTAPQSSTRAIPVASSGLVHVKTKASTISKPPIDRDELRRRGQEALEKLRSSSSNAGSRRRLIEEGRQLLKQKQAISSSSSTMETNTDGISPKKFGSVRPLPPAAPPRTTATDTSKTEPQKNSSLSAPIPSVSSKAPTLGMRTKPSAPHVTKVTKIHPVEDDKADDGWDFDDF